jgi:hypothetical protein
MVIHTSGVCGMVALEEQVAIPFNNDVLEVGRDRIVGILTKVIPKNVNSISSGVKRFTDVDGSILEADEVKDVTNSRREVLESIRRDDYIAVNGGG